MYFFIMEKFKTMDKRMPIFETDIVRIPWGTTGYIIIDFADYDLAKDYDWYFHVGKFRSKSYKRGVSWYLHHLMFGYINDGRKLLWKDGNIFNYRRENLYFVGGKVAKQNY